MFTTWAMFRLLKVSDVIEGLVLERQQKLQEEASVKTSIETEVDKPQESQGTYPVLQDEIEGEYPGSPNPLMARRPLSGKAKLELGSESDVQTGQYDSSMVAQLDIIIDKSTNLGENNSQQEFLLKRFQDFPELLGYKNYRCYEMVTIFINSMVNLVFNLTNLTYVFKLLVVMFPMPMIVIKLSTFAIYAVVIVLVIEPEKLRWMTTITMTTFMTISKHDRSILIPSLVFLLRFCGARHEQGETTRDSLGDELGQRWQLPWRLHLRL